jgi:2-phosphosulfolactate phosphatase
MEARGVVIVIDVIRAFTVAAYAFAGGAARLWLVSAVDEAFALREREPRALLAGEVGGRLIPGFDFNNSPSLMAAADVHGRLLIQRTGAGTQGATRAVNAAHLLVCSLVNAQATATYARKLAGATGGLITLLPTFSRINVVSEDEICADYLEALLREREATADIVTNSITQLRTLGRFAQWEQGDQDFPFGDIEKILDANRFDFAMVGTHKQWEGIGYVEVERRDPTELIDRH